MVKRVYTRKVRAEYYNAGRRVERERGRKTKLTEPRKQEKAAQRRRIGRVAFFSFLAGTHAHLSE